MIETKLSNHELTCTIEALHDMVRNRMSNSLRYEPYRQVPWSVMRQVIGNSMTAYWTLRNDLVDKVDVIPEFLATFGFSEELMDMEATMTQADSWGEVPNHSSHKPETCDLCTELTK